MLSLDMQWMNSENGNISRRTYFGGMCAGRRKSSTSSRPMVSARRGMPASFGVGGSDPRLATEKGVFSGDEVAGNGRVLDSLLFNRPDIGDVKRLRRAGSEGGDPSFVPRVSSPRVCIVLEVNLRLGIELGMA